MLNRIAHLESVIESQKAQIHRQAEKINDIWKLLQGPSSACAFENHPPITVTPHSSSTLPLFTSSAFNVVPGISNGVLSTSTNHIPETHTQRGTKRKEPHSPSPRAKDVIKHKRRRSIRATSKFIKTLALSPINARDKANKYKKSTPSMMTSVTASVSTSSPTQNTHIMKSLSSAQKYQSIIQVLSPSSRVVSNKLSQCQTYTAVGKLIALEGSNATSIHDRFAVVCALGDKMTKQGSNTTNNRWYTNFLNSTGAIEVFVQWLHEFSKYFHKLLDEKMIIMTQYMNGFNANASGVMDRFKICGMTSQYVEVLIFIIEEVSKLIAMLNVLLDWK